MPGDYISQLQLTKQLEQKAKEAAKNRKAAEEKLAEAEKTLATAKDFGALTAEAEKLLVQGADAFSKKDYKAALGLAAQCIESAERAKKEKISSILSLTTDLLTLVQAKDVDSDEILASIGKAKGLLHEAKTADAFSLATSSWDKAEQYVNRRMADLFGQAQSLILIAESTGLNTESERRVLSEARKQLEESQYEPSIKQLRVCLDKTKNSLRSRIETLVSEVLARRDSGRELGIDFSATEALLENVRKGVESEDFEGAIGSLRAAEAEAENTLADGIQSSLDKLRQRTEALRKGQVEVEALQSTVAGGKDLAKSGKMKEAMEAWRTARANVWKAEEDLLLVLVSKLRSKFLIARRVSVDVSEALQTLESSRQALRDEDFARAADLVAEADRILEKALEGYREVEKELAATKALMMSGAAYHIDLSEARRLMDGSREMTLSRDFKGAVAQLRTAQGEAHKTIQESLAKVIMDIELKIAAAMKMGADLSEEHALLDEIIGSVKEGEYLPVSDLIQRCSEMIDEKTRLGAEAAVSAATRFIDLHLGQIDIASAKELGEQAVAALKSGHFEKAHDLAMTAMENMRQGETASLAEKIEEARRLLDITRELGSESKTLRDKLAKAERLKAANDSSESFKITVEVIHFAKSIIKDDMTRNLATLSKSIASARRSGVEVMKVEHLAEDASRAIDGGDFARVFALVEEARRSLETTVALHTEVYDRIVETSGLLKEAADHGRDTSSASALLGKAKRMFEAGKYEEAKQALITCHSETEKIVAPFIASRRIPLVRDLLAVSKRMLLDMTSVGRMVDTAESQIRYGSFVDALNTTKEAERLVKEALIKGVSKEIAESRGTLMKARKAGADVRTAEQILLKAETLLREKRFNDSLRAVELAKSELDQSIVMERKASEQMQKAQAIVSDVQSFDIDVNPALEILRQAGNYSGMGRHGIAIELAKKAAEQASQAARASVAERLNKVEANYKSASLEGPDLGAAVAIRDEIMRLLDQRRFKETGALIKSMAAEVERVLAQKKLSARTLLEVRKQLEEARRRGLHSDRTDSLLAKADERMRGGAFSEAFATAMRCSEELRSLAEFFDRRMSDVEALRKDVQQLEADARGAAGTADLLGIAEEALKALDFEKASLNIQRARTAVNREMESRAKEGLRDLVAMNRMAKELGIEEKLVPASLKKTVGMKVEEVKAMDLSTVREGLETLRLLILDKLTKRELELRGKIEVAMNAGADVTASMSLLTKAREFITSKQFQDVPGVLADAEASIGVATEKRKSYLDLKARCESLIASAKKKGLVMDGVAKLFREAEKERARDYDKAIATVKEAIAVAEKEVASLMPEIVIGVDFPEKPAEGRWTRLKVHLRNEGTGLARDLSISMVGEIEVKGPGQMKWLRGGEKVSLDFEIMPRSKGPMSVKLNLACKPALSDELCGFESSFDLIVQ